MLKKLRANTLAKKTTIFAVVFAISCILMGGQMIRMEARGDTAAVMSARSAQTGIEMLALKSATLPTANIAVTPVILSALERPDPGDFPFSGEYPAVTAEPIPTKPLVSIRIAVPEGFVYSSRIPLSRELQEYTYTRCVERGLEYEMVLAVMWRESRFTLNAVNINANGTQDSGIMQINDVNRGWLKEKHGIVDLMDPIQNIDAGTIMLSNFIDKYGVHDGIMAYQYGEAGMRRKLRLGMVVDDKVIALVHKRDEFSALLAEAT